MRSLMWGLGALVLAATAVPAQAQFTLTQDDPCFDFLQDLIIPGYAFGYSGGMPDWNSVDELSRTATATYANSISMHKSLSDYRKALAAGSTEPPSADNLRFLKEYRDCLPKLQQFLREISARLKALDTDVLVMGRERVELNRFERQAVQTALDIMDEINAIQRQGDRVEEEWRSDDQDPPGAASPTFSALSPTP